MPRGDFLGTPLAVYFIYGIVKLHRKGKEKGHGMTTTEIDSKIENLYNTLTELKEQKLQRRKQGKDTYYVKLAMTETRTQIGILNYKRRTAAAN